MSSTNSPLLLAENIVKNYGRFEREQVLKSVSLELRAGQAYALLGASGSGKSTLLYCLSLLDRFDRGELYFKGRNISRLSSQMAAEFRLQNLGFVFQFHHLIYELSVIENILLPAQIRGEVPVETKAWAEELLKKVGLEAKREAFPWSLSGGESQRVAVARALVNKPSLLLTDEATGNLDATRASDVLALILEIGKETETAVLSVTHDENHAKLYPHRFRLVDGKILKEK
jgi:lipoprotein-releasing system ATP-binding protein